MISKENFVEAINAMMEIDDYQNDKNALYKKYNADGYLLEPDNNNIIIKLLKLLLPQECDFDALLTFCINNNYGRGKNKQEYIDIDGQSINISSPESLYDYLLSSSGVVI